MLIVSQEDQIVSDYESQWNEVTCINDRFYRVALKGGRWELLLYLRGFFDIYHYVVSFVVSQS